MFHHINYVKHVRLPPSNRSLIKFAENLEFTCSPVRQDLLSNVTYNIENGKGVFEITKIADIVNGVESENKYEKYGNQFISSTLSSSTSFYITAKIQLKEMCVTTYQLRISAARLQCLELFYFYKDEFMLPGFNAIFTYFVKKVKEASGKDIEIHIVNQRDMKIQGKKGDFKIQQSSANGVDLLLSFGFCPGIFFKKPAYST